MISYDRNPQQMIPESSVKIIGLGGAGANMVDRAALDGMTGAEMLCINTDMRTLSSSVVREKIQIGKNLTKGLGAGGDPELGLKAAQESEAEIRDAIRGRRMIFLCVGLGGGTGSGAAPLVSRIAREEDAFVVVFATMPFGFEGRRRRDQAEASLNELAVIANALVTFDNGRMGELVLAKQGIHEAFAAADRMISESIKAVTRLVVRPGLINVGLDDLMTSLKTTRSRCLFGSGLAEGESRSKTALENALTSPLLDKGSLLEDATTVLVHICGGESMTLYEVELLMQALSKYIPESAHVLFGAAVDPAMNDSLSVTLISALPEDRLNPVKTDVAQSPEKESSNPEAAQEEDCAKEAVPKDEEKINDVDEHHEDTISLILETPEPHQANTLKAPDEEPLILPSTESDLTDEQDKETESKYEPEAEIEEEEEVSEEPEPEAEVKNLNTVEEEIEESETGSEDAIENRTAKRLDTATDDSEPSPEEQSSVTDKAFNPLSQLPPRRKQQKESAQAELELDGGPKGKFEGANPNFHEGEDLDIPAFLRKRRKK